MSQRTFEKILNSFLGKMKKYILITIATLFCCFTTSAQQHVRVDEVHELSAIVWRLAGCEEYNSGMYEEYAKDIEDYFGMYTDHPVMEHIRKMRNKPDSADIVAINSVPIAASALKIRNGHVAVRKEYKSRENADKYFKAEDDRWDVDDFFRYVRLLDDFYSKSNFHDFFEAHSGLYSQYIEIVEAQISSIHQEWFEDFYGTGFPAVSAIISPAYSIHNFSGDDNDGLCPIIGMLYSPEQLKMMGDIYIVTLSHEISHIFSSMVMKPYKDMLRKIGERIFPYIEDEVSRYGYGDPEAFMTEALNEVWSILYLRDKLGMDVCDMVARWERRGMVWTGRTVRFMNYFYEHRDMYPTINDFMPQLVGFMSNVADNIDAISRQWRFEHCEPIYVESVYPAPGTVVPADLEEIKITFSRPMDGLVVIKPLEMDYVLSIYADTLEEVEELGIDPENTDYWSDDRKTQSLKICTRLQQGRKYGIKIPGGFMGGRYGNPPFNDDINIWFEVE